MKMPGWLYTLVNPAAHLMDRLRFGQKLVVSAAAFVAAIAVLAWIVVPELNADIEFNRKELRGISAIGPLHGAIRALQAHRGTSYRVLRGDAAAADALPALGDAVAVEFGKVGDWLASDGAGMGLEAQWQAAEAAWGALEAATGVDAAVSFSNHNALVEQVIAFGEAVADKSNLTLDPELDSYMLMDAAIFRLPAAVEQIGRLRGFGAGVVASGTLGIADHSELLASARLAEAALQRGLGGLRGVADGNVDFGPELLARVDAIEGNWSTFRSMLEQRVLAAEGISVAPQDYFDAGTAAVDAGYAAMAATIPPLEQLVEARTARYVDKRSIALAAIGLALLLALYLFLGFSRSLSATLRGLSRATADIARGVFPEPIVLRTRDELQDIADQLVGVTQVLKRFTAAQKTMFERHEAGETSHRIDSEGFGGAFGEMVASSNALVASHIAIKTRVVDVIQAYARGDFRRDMDRLPGEEARITEAMDAVKRQLGAMQDEVARVASAAASGDFALRGDSARFEFAFRDIVEGLNRLMDNADAGLHAVAATLELLAKGDLTASMDGRFEGRFAEIQRSANETVSQLTAIVSRIKDSAGSIDVAAKEIASGNQDLSQRTEEQAASLEETASSMEELTATVKQNAENARQANQLAVGATEVATKGGEVVGRVVSTMGEISASSKKIADIIGVIDGIAFQTNILALNAAVEAARAGEQGRGFAVVAAEVRALAQRSASAAKEIKELISGSVEKVNEGSTLVEQAGRTMGEIVASVKRVTDIMGEITAASAEQSSGIEQINTTVTQMDQTTQQNAALVEEASASARSLEEQAAGLLGAVAAFRLAGGSVSAVVSSTKPVAAANDGTAAVVVHPGVKRLADAGGAARATVARESTPAGTADDEHWRDF